MRVDFKGKVKITHIQAMTTKDEAKKVASFELKDSSNKVSEKFTFEDGKSLQVFQLATPVVTNMAEFVLQRKGDSKASLSLGVVVLGFPADDQVIVTVSDKTVNPEVTCEASEGTCMDGLTSKMTGAGWLCSKGDQCSLKINLGSDFSVHGLSIKNIQTEKGNFVSSYDVKVGDKDNTFAMTKAQAGNSQTFRMDPPVTGSTITIKVKNIEDKKDVASLGGFFAIYGHKADEKKQEQNVSPKLTPNDELNNNDDFFCEDYPIYQ